MELNPRPYRDPDDFDAMRSLLIAGRQADNGAYYVHVGDVSWWLFYPDQASEFAERIYLWEGERLDGPGLLGWALLTPDERCFDAFVHPSEQGSPRAAQMRSWAEQALEERLAGAGPGVRTTWVSARDADFIAHLEGRGFARTKSSLTLFTRALAQDVPPASPPAGFSVRPVAGEHEVRRRAAASHAAFRSRLPFEAYWPRYRSFMRSPVYEAERDMVVEPPAPASEADPFAAFCIYWLDPVNRVGLFEPVGTHPDYQRKGLGQAVMLESLRRMRAHGMNSATVCSYSDNPAAIRLYQSIGFRPIDTLWTYAKSI